MTTLQENLKIFADEAHKPARYQFTRRSAITNAVNEYWGADLIDMSNVKDSNNNIRFLLNVIDLYSRYAWSIPLQNKTGEEVLTAFESIGVTPKNLWVDLGKEFYNQKVKKWCEDNNINMYSTQSGLKSVFVERFNRTMKDAFAKYFTTHQHKKYTTYLPLFLNEYNHKIHSVTKESPYDIYNNKATKKRITKKYRIN